jgi:hypothetical protein
MKVFKVKILILISTLLLFYSNSYSESIDTFYGFKAGTSYEDVMKKYKNAKLPMLRGSFHFGFPHLQVCAVITLRLERQELFGYPCSVDFHFTPITRKLYGGDINFDADISNTDIIKALDTKYGKPKMSENNLPPMGKGNLKLSLVKNLLYKDKVCETRDISVSYFKVFSYKTIIPRFSTNIDYFIASPQLKEELEKECKKITKDWEEEKSRTFEKKLEHYRDKL